MKNLPLPDEPLITEMREIRRHLHQYPELAFEEYKTAEFIAEKLRALEIPFRQYVGGTGIVATIGAGNEGPCIALRADMDALPIAEQTGLPFSSLHPGIMHACGHDGHVAMLLGASELLNNIELPGKAVLLFQPAEERDAGAKKMIADGALSGVDMIFAVHIDRHFAVNEIAVEPGLICAFADQFQITVSSRGGHAAKPHETADSIVVASLLVMSIQTLVSREVNPAFPSVITVGRINGGSAANAIASEATLQGTIRTTHPEIRQTVITGLTRMVKAMENLYQVATNFILDDGYPPVINDPVASAIAREAAAGVVGEENVKNLPNPSLGGEDFSFYLKEIPGCLVRLGAKRPELGEVPAHSPNFDFNEDVLPVGARFLAQVACYGLEKFRHSKV